ncbi:MAG: exosortase system-associated protein, TIGR04073 family [Candidatus Omnitrophica bacterium]|nr:exosortase system-associated protein, TIGR04073 family [Candidatus Omnitrophota bacterium]
MKKTTCFFIILTQLFSFLAYAQVQNTTASAKDQPAQAAPSQSQAAASDKGIRKVEVTPAPAAKKEEVKAQEPQKEEVKEQTAAKEEIKSETPCTAEGEQGTVVLRERTSDQNPLRKVARGAVNTTLGWVEIPRQMIKENKDKGDIAGVFWGPLKGFAFFVGRTAVGLYEVTTFLIPPYKPVVKPEFILSDEDSD